VYITGGSGGGCAGIFATECTPINILKVNAPSGPFLPTPLATAQKMAVHLYLQGVEVGVAGLEGLHIHFDEIVPVSYTHLDVYKRQPR